MTTAGNDGSKFPYGIEPMKLETIHILRDLIELDHKPTTAAKSEDKVPGWRQAKPNNRHPGLEPCSLGLISNSDALRFVLALIHFHFSQCKSASSLSPTVPVRAFMKIWAVPRLKKPPKAMAGAFVPRPSCLMT
jgi:hypothetical protein